MTAAVTAGVVQDVSAKGEDSPRRGTSERGAMAMLTVFTAALLLIPDRYTVPLDARLGLRPYQLVILVLATTLAVRFVRGRRLSVGRPACVAGMLIVVSVASLVANLQRLSEPSFMSAVRLIVTLTFQVLVAAAVAAVVSTPRRRRFLVGTLVTVVAVGSIFALHESSTQEPIRLRPTPPGLVEEDDPTVAPGDVPREIIRNGVARPAGLAANPLELSAVMALTAPFGVYMALSSRSVKARVWFLACGLLICLGIAASMSRTGVLASAVMLVIALGANVHRPKIVLVGLLMVGTLGFAVSRLVPASVDSLVQQIGKDGDDDPSLATRLQDYEELDALLGPHPWLGRGPESVSAYVSRDGTDMILDNQYLLSIAETGVLGLLALLALIGSTFATAARRARDAVTERGLFVAAACAAAAFAVMCVTFDVLRFAQASSLFMIVVGITAAAGGPHPSVAPQARGAL